MTDQLMLLAEAGAETGGVSAPAVGIGLFLLFMVLLGITWLTGGAHHRSLDEKSSDRDR